jgi:hypothetical protein
MERKFKSYTEGAVRPGWSGDVIGSYALRIGNIETAASTGMETRATIAVIAAIFFMMCSPFVLIWLLLRPTKLNDFLSGKKKF